MKYGEIEHLVKQWIKRMVNQQVIQFNEVNTQMAYLKINFDFFSDMKSVYTCSDVENEKKSLEIFRPICVLDSR